MLFTGWKVRIVKNCDRGMENAARGHSFSLYGPTLSRQINYLFISRYKLAYRYGWRNGAKFTKFIFIHIQCSY